MFFAADPISDDEAHTFATRFANATPFIYRHMYLRWIDVAHPVCVERSLMAERRFGHSRPEDCPHEGAVPHLRHLRHTVKPLRYALQTIAPGKSRKRMSRDTLLLGLRVVM